MCFVVFVQFFVGVLDGVLFSRVRRFFFISVLGVFLFWNFMASLPMRLFCSNCGIYVYQTITFLTVNCLQ